MTLSTFRSRLIVSAMAVTVAALAACSSMGGGMMTGGGLKLTGDQEVPPVATGASGMSTVAIAADGSVSGSITTTGIAATMAHVHIGAMGKNGPVIVPMTKTSDNVWSVAPGAKLTPEQLKAYQAGELYVNVHSDANKAGEIRAQLKP